MILAQDLERLVRGRRAVVSELIDALLSCGHFEPLAGERRLRTRGLLLRGGRLVGSFLGIVSRFLCLLGLRVALVASLRISQGRLLVSAPERP